MNAFSKWAKGWDGLRTYCRECSSLRAKASYARDPAKHRDRMRDYACRRRYGISLAEAEAMRAAGCAVCGAHEEAGRELSIDHCHDTGKVRGALCFACNTALGKLADDPSRIRRLAAYVEGAL